VLVVISGVGTLYFLLVQRRKLADTPEAAPIATL
jgi:hypothetical protein